ncbi:MAG TPA: ATP-binding protein, partial [Bacteroidetes bacterium]|nr:ATP-binding protein [Bacteroidota bacterium]
MLLTKSNLHKIHDFINQDDLAGAFSSLSSLFADNPDLDKSIAQLPPYQKVKNRIFPADDTPIDDGMSQDLLIENLLQVIEALEQQVEKSTVTIENSSAVVVGSEIKAGHDVHIGDKIYASNPYADKLYLSNNYTKVKEIYLKREDELAKVRQLLDKHKYVTIHGASGLGKSTFASVFMENFKGDFTSVGWINYEISLTNSIVKSLSKPSDTRECKKTEDFSIQAQE